MRRSGGPGSIGRARSDGATTPWRRCGTSDRRISIRASRRRCGRGSVVRGGANRGGPGPRGGGPGGGGAGGVGGGPWRRGGDTGGEVGPLEEWLGCEPATTPALERLAERAQGAGQANRVPEPRRRRAEVGGAIEAYRARLWRD